jgi:uncharacterized membrane protein YgdD (TMEM256/DUF423 family)
MARVFLLLGTLFAFTGVAAGAFGSHAVRSKLTPERLGTFETAVRYQFWHALALFGVVFVTALGPSRPFGWTSYAPLVAVRHFNLPDALAGLLFIAGILLFSGSLYMLALTADRRWARVTPIGGLCLLAGWASLGWAILVR